LDEVNFDPALAALIFYPWPLGRKTQVLQPWVAHSIGVQKECV
jgi:hypothetical protein